MSKATKELNRASIGTAGTQFWKGPGFDDRGNGVSRRMLFRHLAAGVGGNFLLPQSPTESIARAATSESPKGTAKQVVFVMLFIRAVRFHRGYPEKLFEMNPRPVGFGLSVRERRFSVSNL